MRLGGESACGVEGGKYFPVLFVGPKEEPQVGHLEHLCTDPHTGRLIPGEWVSDCTWGSTRGHVVVEFVQMPLSHFTVVPFRYWVTLTMLSQPSLLLKSC